MFTGVLLICMSFKFTSLFSYWLIRYGQISVNFLMMLKERCYGSVTDPPGHPLGNANIKVR